MTVDKRLPIPEQRGYSSIFNAWSRIIKDEGVASLWTGCRPTIARAMIVNASQLSVNTQAKYALNHLTTSKIYRTGESPMGTLTHGQKGL